MQVVFKVSVYAVRTHANTAYRYLVTRRAMAAEKA